MPPPDALPLQPPTGSRPLRFSLATLVKLLLACLVVGFLLAWLDIRPPELADRVVGAATTLAQFARSLFDRLFESAGDVVSYILLGAVVVIPVWLASLLLRALRRKR